MLVCYHLRTRGGGGDIWIGNYFGWDAIVSPGVSGEADIYGLFGTAWTIMSKILATVLQFTPSKLKKNSILSFLMSYQSPWLDSMNIFDHTVENHYYMFGL